MARKLIKGRKEYFECEQCGFVYTEGSWAEKCEKWCKEHNSCSLEITRHATKTD